MTDIALKIDIQTILKMVKFNEHFRNLFKNLTFFDSTHDKIIDDYVMTSDITNKNMLWSILTTINNIPEINSIIDIWRLEENNSLKIEKNISEMDESNLSHVLVGRVIEFVEITDKYKKLILEIKKQNFQYNGFKIIPHGDSFFQLFF